MASKGTSACVHGAKVPRISAKDSLSVFYMDLSQDGSRLAVSGGNDNKEDRMTFVDLFALRHDPDSQEVSLFRTSEPYFSKEFSQTKDSSWLWRSVSLLDDSVFVTCCDDEIESYDSKQDCLVSQCKLDGRVNCITIRGERIYVGLTFRDVIVFDRLLNQINTIKLKEITGWPRDIAVNNNKLFISAGKFGTALRYNINGDVEQTYQIPNLWCSFIESVTVSEKNGLIYTLWMSTSRARERFVIVYSLPRGHSSIHGGHSYHSGCHYLVAFNVSKDSMRIRINDNVNRLFVVTRTGEICEYHTNDVVNLNNLLTLIELLLKLEYQKLLKWFKFPDDEAKAIEESDEPSKKLFQHLRETGKISDEDISPLLTACDHLRIPEVTEAWTNYQSYLSYHKLLRRLKQSENQRKQLKISLIESTNARQELINILEEIQLEKVELRKRLVTAEGQGAQVYYKLGESGNDTVELADRLENADEWSRELTDNLTNSTDPFEEELTQTEISNVSQGSAALALDYGRLIVDVAEDLTLDHTLKLAYLLKLSNSEKDMLRRISLIETPGITLINFLKTRNVINMYDVTNLQKGLLRLHLYSTNAKHVVPYQKKIDPCQFEENRSPDLLDWPDQKSEASTAVETSVSQDPGHTDISKRAPKESVGESLKTEVEGMPKPRQDLQNMHRMQPYMEHKVNCSGGTITLSGVCLSIPYEALSGEYIIAVTVTRDPEVLLPGSARRGRMTPLIKLEPEGLNLNKPALLTIAHSAIIPEPDRHNVVIFTGLSAHKESQEDQITWTEEKSLEWKLAQETISLNINTLSYVYVNLVNQKMDQIHMFRVVPFIDGILNTKDDVFITVCFCKDNDLEYKMLLKELKPKLILGDHKTFQVSRSSLNDGKETGSCLELVMKSLEDNYHLQKGETKQVVDIDQLCATSRVSHRFRLKRNRNDEDTDIIDVMLKVSQEGRKEISLILQSKVRNILLTPESQDLLCGDITRDLQQYENLKKTVSRLLDNHHCEKLAVFFDLTPAERDTVQNNEEPGMVLINILDERELIMPDKMLGLYEGLKASHLNKIGRHVLEYIDASQREKLKEEGIEDADQREKLQTNDKDVTQETKVFQMSRNTKMLIEEGYKILDVHRALQLSHGKLDLARRILLLAKDEHERLLLFPGSTLYKEQYIDEHGGDLIISGIHLFVPAGALHTGRIISLRVSADPTITGPISNESLRLAPFVTFGPPDVIFQKPVVMIIPHCALITNEQKGLGVHSGVLQKDKTIQWNLEWKQFSCLMNNHHLEVKIQKSCLIGPHIPYHSKMRKRICVVPILRRLSGLEDELTICLWFYNDEKLEYESLVNEELHKNKGIELHPPVSVLLESMTSTLPVNIYSRTPQCIPSPKRVDVAADILWLQNRHVVVFNFQRTDRGNVSLEIGAKPGILKKPLFRFNIQLKLDDMLHSKQVTSPFQNVLNESIVESFEQLKQRLSEHLTEGQSTQLANIFQLPEDAITRVKNQRKPGYLLLDTLAQKSLISPANVSTLENALTAQGNEDCARFVRDFRKNNPVVQATMWEETF